MTAMSAGDSKTALSLLDAAAELQRKKGKH
jgi:hypothetical protein